MTADSELFVTETICYALEQKIREVIPKGFHINTEIPPGWWGIWGAAAFPNHGEAEVTLWRGDSKAGRFGTVSWETKFSVADFGGPAKCIEAWPTNLRFRKTST
jgi:hypothetical protein